MKHFVRLYVASSAIGLGRERGRMSLIGIINQRKDRGSLGETCRCRYSFQLIVDKHVAIARPLHAYQEDASVTGHWSRCHCYRVSGPHWAEHQSSWQETSNCTQMAIAICLWFCTNPSLLLVGRPHAWGGSFSHHRLYIGWVALRQKRLLFI